MDYAAAIPISIGILAIAGSLTKLYTVKKNGNGNGNSKNKYMSDEAKVSTTKLWEDKQSKEMCEVITGGFKDDITEIKDSQKETKKGIQDIQQTLINWKP